LKPGEIFAKLEKRTRPLFAALPPQLAAYLFSTGRRFFIDVFINTEPKKIHLPEVLKRKCWNIDFQSPLMNAAGMFKNGLGYSIAVNSGSGAFLAGTSTSRQRDGNCKLSILHPFAAFPKSAASLNWMGLPNEGNIAMAKILSEIEKQPGCPIGASIAASPDVQPDIALIELIEGLKLFDKAGVDFIEINESCPNVAHDYDIDRATGLDKALLCRLEAVSDGFLKKRKRNLPVILKLSNDTDESLVKNMLETAVALDFDGINFGNTSTRYGEVLQEIKPEERRLFDYFSSTFGGGISGKPLKASSANLCRKAAAAIEAIRPNKEFHLIRTGGISSAKDLLESDECGASLSQWFTGFFERFSIDGFSLYENLFNSFVDLKEAKH